MCANRIDHCSRCGELFVSIHRNICASCLEEIEQEFRLCADFLRNKENRMSTLQEMSEKTGVSVDQIIEFIRQKRLIVTDYDNIDYPCEGCGAMIKQERLCDECKQDWQDEINELFAHQNDPEEKEKKLTYYIKDNKRR